MNLLLRIVQRMLPAFSACCEELVSRWAESLGSDGSCELDVWPELQNLTGDVISRTAFSSSYQEGKKDFPATSRASFACHDEH